MIKLGSLRSNNKLWFEGIIEFGYYGEELGGGWATWKEDFVSGPDIQDCIQMVSETSMSCITESSLDDKHNLERILKSYASAWKKLADYDKQKEKS